MNEEPTIITVPARLNEIDLAKLLGVSRSSLRGQRIRNRGLPYRKLPNGQVFYDVEDLKPYIEGVKVYTKDFPEPA